MAYDFEPFEDEFPTIPDRLNRLDRLTSGLGIAALVVETHSAILVSSGSKLLADVQAATEQQ